MVRDELVDTLDELLALRPARCSVMAMPVVHVRIVRMLVRQDLVPVSVRMRLPDVPRERMRVLVVFVVVVPVRVLQRLVRVLALVAFTHMQLQAQ